MISSAEDLSCFVQGQAGHTPDQVHSDLTGVEAVPVAGWSFDLILFNSEVTADFPENCLRRDNKLVGFAHVLDSAVHRFPVDGDTAVQIARSEDHTSEHQSQETIS